MQKSILEIVKSLKAGYSEGIFNNTKYGITKMVFNNGKSFKIYAKELRGTDYISLNLYVTKKGELVMPCEMSHQKVKRFLNDVLVEP